MSNFISRFKLLNEVQQGEQVESLIYHNQEQLLLASEISDKLFGTMEEFTLGEITLSSINLHNTENIRAFFTFTVTRVDNSSIHPINTGEVVLSGEGTAMIDSHGRMEFTKLSADPVPEDGEDELSDFRDTTEQILSEETRACRDCGSWFKWDFAYDYVICPRCLEGVRAERDRPREPELTPEQREQLNTLLDALERNDTALNDLVLQLTELRSQISGRSHEFLLGRLRSHEDIFKATLTRLELEVLAITYIRRVKTAIEAASDTKRIGDLVRLLRSHKRNIQQWLRDIAG
jgi:hypothetical protein